MFSPINIGVQLIYVRVYTQCGRIKLDDDRSVKFIVLFRDGRRLKRTAKRPPVIINLRSAE